jgi:hypothetical protein
MAEDQLTLRSGQLENPDRSHTGRYAESGQDLVDVRPPVDPAKKSFRGKSDRLQDSIPAAKRDLGPLLLGHVTEAPHPAHRLPVEPLRHGESLEDPAIAQLDRIEALRLGHPVELSDPRQECLGIDDLIDGGLQQGVVIPALDRLRRDAPHLNEPLVVGNHPPHPVDDQQTIGGRLDRGAQQGETVFELTHGQAALGFVPSDHQHGIRAFPLIGDGDQVGVHQTAVDPLDLLLRSIHCRAGDHLVQPFVHQGAARRRDVVDQIATENVRLRMNSEHPHGGRVGEDDPSVLEDHDQVRSPLHQLAVALLALAQERLGALPIGHVHRGQDDSCGTAIPVTDHRPGDVHGDRDAVPAAPAHGVLAEDPALERAGTAADPFLSDDVADGKPGQLGRAEMEQIVGGAVREPHSLVQVEHDHRPLHRRENLAGSKSGRQLGEPVAGDHEPDDAHVGEDAEKSEGKDLDPQGRKEVDECDVPDRDGPQQQFRLLSLEHGRLPMALQGVVTDARDQKNRKKSQKQKCGRVVPGIEAERIEIKAGDEPVRGDEGHGKYDSEAPGEGHEAAASLELRVEGQRHAVEGARDEWNSQVSEAGPEHRGVLGDRPVHPGERKEPGRRDEVHHQEAAGEGGERLPDRHPESEQQNRHRGDQIGEASDGDLVTRQIEDGAGHESFSHSCPRGEGRGEARRHPDPECGCPSPCFAGSGLPLLRLPSTHLRFAQLTAFRLQSLSLHERA